MRPALHYFPRRRLFASRLRRLFALGCGDIDPEKAIARLPHSWRFPLTRRRSRCFDSMMVPEFQAPPARRFHVLVVDDEKDIRTTLAMHPTCPRRPADPALKSVTNQP